MRFRASPYRYPEQPVILIERTLAEIPFAITGVDYSGPHEIREGYERVKVWVCLFTCLVSRAVYLVLVKDITSLTFLAALQELICRRGRPKMLVSDNATTFTHTCKMLKEISQVAEVVNELANEGIVWRFIPAKAPWFGGIYERLIGIMKKELAKMYDGTVFTEFQMRNHLYEIEKVMNNRPLTCVGANEVITPAHILFGATAKLDDIFSSFNSDGIVENALRARKELPRVYKESQKRTDHFWKALQSQYLDTLRFSRDKMRNRFIKVPRVGDIVIIHGSDPRIKWRMAKIVEVVYSKDGEIRQCKVETENCVMSRPVNQLYSLEINAEDEVEKGRVEQQRERGRRFEERVRSGAEEVSSQEISQEQSEQVEDGVSLEEERMTPDVLPEVLVVGGQEELVESSQATERSQGVLEDVDPVVEVQEVASQDREASASGGQSGSQVQAAVEAPCAVAPIAEVISVPTERRPRRQAAIKAVERVRGWINC